MNLNEIALRVQQWAESEEGQKEIGEKMVRAQETIEKLRKGRTVSVETLRKQITI